MKRELGTRPNKTGGEHAASRASAIDTIGYNGGTFDRHFIYGIPVCDDVFHGRVIRYATLAEDLFVPKCSDYGHNSGLSAAVPEPSTC